MFGVEIGESAFIITAVIALLAGAMSFLSPCVLPIVPPFLAYMGGMGGQNASNFAAQRRVLIWLSCFFVLGLSTIFIILGMSASLLGTFFIKNQVLFGQIAGIVIIVFGLHFIGIFKIKILNIDTRFTPFMRTHSPFNAYILGLAFAFGWTPCMGPYLASILTITAQEATVWQGAVLLAIYALGLGVPFILSAVFFAQLHGRVARLRHHIRKVEIVMGIFLILVGGMIFSGTLPTISYWLLETFPSLAWFG